MAHLGSVELNPRTSCGGRFGESRKKSHAQGEEREAGQGWQKAQAESQEDLHACNATESSLRTTPSASYLVGKRKKAGTPSQVCMEANAENHHCGSERRNATPLSA